MRKIKGLTLTELLIVMAILSFLMLLAVLLVRHQISKGYDSRRKTDIYQIKVAVEEYEKDHNCYPQYVLCEGDFADDLGTYIPYIPCDPEFHNSYMYVPDNTSSCPRSFHIFTRLQNDSDPQIEELGCINGCGGTPQTSSVYNYYVSSPNAPDPFFGEATQFTPAPIIENSGYYGCKSGTCVEISQIGTSLECSPSYSNITCWNLCSNPANACR